MFFNTVQLCCHYREHQPLRFKILPCECGKVVSKVYPGVLQGKKFILEYCEVCEPEGCAHC